MPSGPMPMPSGPDTLPNRTGGGFRFTPDFPPLNINTSYGGPSGMDMMTSMPREGMDIQPSLNAYLGRFGVLPARKQGGLLAGANRNQFRGTGGPGEKTDSNVGNVQASSAHGYYSFPANATGASLNHLRPGGPGAGAGAQTFATRGF